MTPERARELLPVITALSEDKTIQVFASGEWKDCCDPGFVFHLQYRVKPKPHDIKWAAEQLEDGQQVRRRSWANADYRLTQSGQTRIGEGRTENGWRILQDDLLADDWEVYEPK